MLLMEKKGYRKEHLVFVDETSTDNRTNNRTYGYSLLGERCRQKGFFLRGNRYSTVAAIHESGVLATQTVLGSFDSDAFYAFVFLKLLPSMEAWPAPRSVLVMDGASIHDQTALKELFDHVGCRLLYLPPYSPDFDPVESLFSEVKYFLRRFGNTMLDEGVTPFDVVQAAFASVDASHCDAWVRQCDNRHDRKVLLTQFGHE